MTPRALPLIRLALISGVVTFGIIAAYVAPETSLETTELYSPLVTVFWIVAIGVLIGMKWLRSAADQAVGSRAASLTIAGWALGEAAAMLGAIILLLTGNLWPLVVGSGVMLIAFVMLPIRG